MATPCKENGVFALSTPNVGRLRAFGQPSPMGPSVAKSVLSELRSPLGDRTNSPRPSASGACTPTKLSSLSPTSATMLQKCARASPAPPTEFDARAGAQQVRLLRIRACPGAAGRSPGGVGIPQAADSRALVPQGARRQRQPKAAQCAASSEGACLARGGAASLVTPCSSC